MFLDLSSTKFINLSHKAIQKVTVMRYHDYCSIKIPYCILKYIFRTNIKVICWLIENEKVHWFKKEFYHSQSATLPSRSYFNLFIRSLSSKHECTEDITYFKAYITHGNAVYGIEDCKIIVKELWLVLCKISYLYIMSNL